MSTTIKGDDKMRAPRVIVPLMPKGVEHNYDITKLTPYLDVIVPLMPKGVEHCDALNAYRER